MKELHNMDYETRKPTQRDFQDYSDFMTNPDNEYNCDHCPERGVNSNDYGLPCGQQNCWVTCHCCVRTEYDKFNL